MIKSVVDSLSSWRFLKTVKSRPVSHRLAVDGDLAKEEDVTPLAQKEEDT